MKTTIAKKYADVIATITLDVHADAPSVNASPMDLDHPARIAAIKYARDLSQIPGVLEVSVFCGAKSIQIFAPKRQSELAKTLGKRGYHRLAQLVLTDPATAFDVQQLFNAAFENSPLRQDKVKR